MVAIPVCCLYVVASTSQCGNPITVVQCRHLIPALNTWAAGRNTRPHGRLPPSYLVMNGWMSSQLKAALFYRLHGSSMSVAFFYQYVTHGNLYNQALADVRSNGVGIKCLYTMMPQRFQTFYNSVLDICLPQLILPYAARDDLYIPWQRLWRSNLRHLQ